LSDTLSTPNTSFLNGARLLALAAGVGFLICLVDDFTPHGTIAHQWGTLIVVVSTALMLGASLWIAFWEMPRWLHSLFVVLIILDILGTGVCAYFLEAYVLLAFMVVALAGWIWHLAAGSPRISAN